MFLHCSQTSNCTIRLRPLLWPLQNRLQQESLLSRHWSEELKYFHFVDFSRNFTPFLMPAETHLTYIFTWFGSRHFECYVTRLVPLRTPVGTLIWSQFPKKERKSSHLKTWGWGGGCILKILVAKEGGGGTIFIWNFFRGVPFSYTTLFWPPPPLPLDVINDRSLKIGVWINTASLNSRFALSRNEK